MPRKSTLPVLSDMERSKLQKLANSSKEEHRIVWSAGMVLAYSERKRIVDIATEFRTMPNTAIKWRDRYLYRGIAGLHDDPRSGKPGIYPEDMEKRILNLLNTNPPPGHAAWNGNLIANELIISDDMV